MAGRRLTIKVVGVAVLLSLATSIRAFGQERELAIRGVVQESYVWCWVAVGEMVFRYFGVPNVNPGGDYQCGVVGILAAGTAAQACASNCALCQVPAGSAEYLEYALEEYPRRVAQATGRRVPAVSVDYLRGPLSPGDLMDTLDRGAPIVAGISPGGRPPGQWVSQHVALISGYQVNGRRLYLKVNDPYPFADWRFNPYVSIDATSNGRWTYWVDYAAFREGMAWAETFVVEGAGYHQPPRLAGKCCFQAGFEVRWCPLNLSGALPEGADCTCNFGYGGFYYGWACN